MELEPELKWELALELEPQLEWELERELGLKPRSPREFRPGTPKSAFLNPSNFGALEARLG